MKRPASARNARGFTLIEMVVTVAIVGLLASIALPMADIAVQRSKERELRDALRQIRLAIDAYKQAVDDGRILGHAQQSGYPPTLQALVDGVDDAKNPGREHRLHFLRRIPRDPFASDSSQDAEADWGKRSYASPPDDPHEGEDVFDVFTRSERVALNGVPYREW